MFCPNCGKQIKDYDNFCRYCGIDLKNDNFNQEQDKEVFIERPEHKQEVVNLNDNKIKKEEYKLPDENAEELVLFDIKKHWMALFWPIVMTPVFFIYFWTIFLNTHSFFSWIVVFILLLPIVYPVLRFNSDKIVITTKYAHIKIGVLNPEEIDIPLKKLDMLDIYQTTMGRILDYGMVSFTYKSEKFDYSYIKSPEDLQYIIDDPARFVHEALEEDDEIPVKD